MTLWKAADQHSPPDIDITNFGWEMKAGILSPGIDPSPNRASRFRGRDRGESIMKRSADVRRKVFPARFTAYVNRTY